MAYRRIARLTRHAVRNLTIAALCLSGSAGAHAAMTLRMHIATHFDAAPGASNTPADSVEDAVVVLGTRYIEVKAGTHTRIFDFATRKRYEIDVPSARYVEYSLFDTLGFRVIEIQSRQNMAKALAAAKVESTALSDLVYNEQSLSLLAAPGEKLDETIEGKDAVYAIGGKPLLRRSLAGTPINEADAASLIQYLRYTAGGHPLALEALARSRQVPEQMTLSYREVGGKQTRGYRIETISTSAPASYDLRPFKERVAAEPEADQLLDRIKTLAPSGLADTRRMLEAQNAAAFTDKRALDFMLGITELALVTGEPVKEMSAEQKALLHDPVIQKASAAIGAHDKAALGAAIPVLEQLRQETMSKRHMLLLFEANDRMALGELNAAKPLFLSALRINPWLAGAYKDLGDLHFRQFDMARAWRCWDAGRRIAPQLANFSMIDQFEKNLLQQHPEYF